MKSQAIDMTASRYGSITALSATGRASSGDRKWLFACDCGNKFEANGYYARSGKIASCPSCSAERIRIASVKHGLTNTPEFEVWTGMHTRCYNANSKDFKDYGLRGIAICERWRLSFEDFLSDMGSRPSPLHSIDRKDNDGDYEPNNCYWATQKEQANNKRNNVNLEINGVTQTLSQWANLKGVNVATVWIRHQQGIRGEKRFQTTTKQIYFNGITDTVSGWSKRTGLKPTTISMRINHYNWSAERALTQGASL